MCFAKITNRKLAKTAHPSNSTQKSQEKTQGNTDQVN